MKPGRNLTLDKQYGDTTGSFGLLAPWKGSVFRRGQKFFELTNHLGNVLVTISDKKLGIDTNGDSTVNYYMADVMTANDYYPFGMGMPERKFAATNAYRYGFNGKENDNEISGQGNKLDFGSRIYDSRIGRWLSPDHIKKEYESPYMAFANNPIWIMDPDGGDTIRVNETYVARRAKGGFKQNTTTSITIQKSPGTDVIYFQKVFDIEFSDGPSKMTSKSEYHVSGNKITSPHTKKKTFLDEVNAGPEDNNWYRLGQHLGKYPELYKYLLTKDPKTYQNVGLAQGAVAIQKVASNISNIVISLALTIPGPKINAKGGDYITLHRSISEAEYRSIVSTNKLSFAPGAMEVKQFWQTKEGLNSFNKTSFAGQYNLEITVPRSLLGKNKPLNTTTQVDESFGPTATVDNATQLNTVNQNIKEMKITPIKNQ